MSEIEDELRESYTKFGPVRAVVRTRFGIAAGENRKRAVEEWPERFYEATTYYEHLQLKAADNIAEPKSPMWWTRVLSEAAAELVKQGVEKGEVVARLKEDFPLSERSLYRYLPQELKQPEPAQLAKARENAVPAGTTTESKPKPREPYSKGLSPSPKEGLRSEFTPSQLSLMNSLQEKGVPYLAEQLVAVEKYRCPKCRTQYGGGDVPPLLVCPNDKEVVVDQMRERCDILVNTVHGFRVTLEIEGEGSSSRSNTEREGLLLSEGIRTVHIPNQMADEYPLEIAELIAALVR